MRFTIGRMALITVWAAVFFLLCPVYKLDTVFEGFLCVWGDFLSVFGWNTASTSGPPQSLPGMFGVMLGILSILISIFGFIVGSIFAWFYTAPNDE